MKSTVHTFRKSAPLSIYNNFKFKFWKKRKFVGIFQKKSAQKIPRLKILFSKKLKTSKKIIKEILKMCHPNYTQFFNALISLKLTVRFSMPKNESIVKFSYPLKFCFFFLKISNSKLSKRWFCWIFGSVEILVSILWDYNKSREFHSSIWAVFAFFYNVFLMEKMSVL